MTVTFQDLKEKETFSVGGVQYVKGRHPSYEPHELTETPPNAHRPRSPRLYIRFAPTAPVHRTRLFRDLKDGDSFTIGSTVYVKGRHPAYRLRDTDEFPPNAHRPDAPALYVRIGSDTVVD